MTTIMVFVADLPGAHAAHLVLQAAILQWATVEPRTYSALADLAPLLLHCKIDQVAF